MGIDVARVLRDVEGEAFRFAKKGAKPIPGTRDSYKKEDEEDLTFARAAIVALGMHDPQSPPTFEQACDDTAVALKIRTAFDKKEDLELGETDLSRIKVGMPLAFNKQVCFAANSVMKGVAVAT